MTLPRAAAIAFAAALFFAAPSLAQQPQPQAPRADQATTPPTPLSTLDPARLALDQIEQSIGREGITDPRLAQARTSLEPVRDDLRAATEGFEQRLADVDARQEAARRSAGRERAAGRSGDRDRSARVSTSAMTKSTRRSSRRGF